MTEAENLRWQFNLAWRLANVHLPHLTDEMCVWAPAANAWNVRRDAAGAWRADWADIEPDPAPPVTIGWLMWHWTWWFSGLVAAAQGRTAPAREIVTWPGSARASVAEIEALVADWSGFLERLGAADLDRSITHLWPEPRPLRQAIAWGNAELMKNVAEIGVVRHLYEARTR